MNSGQGNGNGAQASATPTSSVQPTKTPAPTPQPEEEMDLGFYVKKALEKGEEGCGDSQECLRLFSLAEKNCSGSTNEKIFCLAVFDSNKDYCGWLSLEWYKATCIAFLDGNVQECLGLKAEAERMLCVKDLAANLEEMDCNALPSEFAAICGEERAKGTMEE